MGGGIDDVQRGLCYAPTGIRTNQARAQLRARVERIIRTPARAYVTDPEDLALIALRDQLRTELTPKPEWIPEHQYWRYSSPPSNSELADAMVEREIARIEAEAEEAVSSVVMRSPNPAALVFSSDWQEQLAQQERTDYEAYLFELGQLREADHAEECSRLRWPGPDCPNPPTSRSPATVDLYTYYLGPPVEAMAQRIGKGMPELVSLALDFVPVVGQLKGLAEAIIGKDIITGRELAAWERGLNALLAILPSAKGIFKAGKNGMQILAQVTRRSGLASREAYLAFKGASELTEVEVKAARAMEKTAVEKVAGKLDDMIGTVRRTPAKTNYRIANGLIEDGKSVTRASKTSADVAAEEAAAKAAEAAKLAEAAEKAEQAAKAAEAAKAGKTGQAAKDAQAAAREARKTATAAKTAVRKAAGEAERAATAAERAKKPHLPREVGKAPTPTKTPEAALEVMKGVSPEAISVLEKAGVKITEESAYRLANKYVGFLNRFYRRPGFDDVVRDLIGGNQDLRKGAELVVDFVSDGRNAIDPLTVAFEVPAGITKGAKAESISRFTDLVVTVGGKATNYEFKSYKLKTLMLWAQSDKKILQLVKDVKMLGTASVRWVFDSRELSRSLVYKYLRRAIQRDAVLAKEFGGASKIDAALDKLVVMYPPPSTPLPGLHGLTKPFGDDDE
jgi:hypothetical protein